MRIHLDHGAIGIADDIDPLFAFLAAALESPTPDLLFGHRVGRTARLANDSHEKSSLHSAARLCGQSEGSVPQITGEPNKDKFSAHLQRQSHLLGTADPKHLESLTGKNIA